MSDNERRIPVIVTIESELEPVKSTGYFVELDNGFAVGFDIGNDGFRIEHEKTQTRITATGTSRYDITLNDGITQTSIATPYGKIAFEVKTLEREVVKLNDDIKIKLRYELLSRVADPIERDVIMTVTFGQGKL